MNLPVRHARVGIRVDEVGFRQERPRSHLVGMTGPGEDDLAIRGVVGHDLPAVAARRQDLPTLGAAHGDTVTLTSDDEAVLDSLATLLATDLDAS